mgnify:CR=1 FL=1
MTDKIKIDDANCCFYLKQGNAAAYEYLIKIYYPPVCYFAQKILMGENSAAEDITTETFLKLWYHQKEFNNIDHLKKFLYRAAKNACLNFLRSREREHTKHKDFSQLQDQLDENYIFKEVVHAELMAHVRKAIDGLSPQMRRIFILSYIEQLSDREIAQQLDISYQTVRNQKSKSLAIIRKLVNIKPRHILTIAILLKTSLH